MISLLFPRILGGAFSAVFICSFLFLAGCATTAPQSVAILRAPPKVAPRIEIPNVAFIDQSAGQCGPASLAMAMQWAGHAVTADEIAPLVMTPGKNGSLAEDLISASRRQGLMAVQIQGMEALLQELNDGHPVIIFENLGLSWYQQWHYALVYGYDLKTEEFRMHSGHEAGERGDMKIFERSWKLSDYWGLVVLPPGLLATSGNELANLRAAVGLEQVDRVLEATLAYKAILTRWPTSLGALVGLGNLAYKRKDFVSAVAFLKEAQKNYPHSDAVAHNLKVAQSAAAATFN